MKVKHWRYEDGMRDLPGELYNPSSTMTNKKFFDGDLQGWHCHVYNANEEFEEWMIRNMVGKFECTFRFNSGNVYHHVYIKSAEDATLFKLTWL